MSALKSATRIVLPASPKVFSIAPCHPGAASHERTDGQPTGGRQPSAVIDLMAALKRRSDYRILTRSTAAQCRLESLSPSSTTNTASHGIMDKQGFCSNKEFIQVLVRMHCMVPLRSRLTGEGCSGDLVKLGSRAASDRADRAGFLERCL